MKSNCSVKCQHVTLTNLSMCELYEDIQCILGVAYYKNLYTKCGKVSHAFAFGAKTTQYEKYTFDDSFRLNLFLVSMSKEVIEEVDIVSTADLIGSVGGSLGMFFGFSLSGNFLYFFDKFIVKVFPDRND